jgi:hypothetical protein
LDDARSHKVARRRKTAPRGSCRSLGSRYGKVAEHRKALERGSGP